MAKTKENIVDKEFEDLQPNNKRTKSIIITVAVILVFGLVFFISQKQEEKLNKQSTNNYFHEITVDQYNELLSRGTKFVLLLGRPGCSHCVAFKPIITSVAKNKEVDVYYLNTDTIETLEAWDSIWGLVEQEGTPTVAVIENNTLVNSTAGEMTSEELIRFLSEAGAL